MSKALRKVAMMVMTLVLLTQAASSAWASSIDCCDDGYAACLSDPSHGSCPFCIAVAAALASVSLADSFGLTQAESHHVVIAQQGNEKIIWKPPKGNALASA